MKNSARKAMDQLDGMEINGSKLQVTQIFHLLPFKQKFKTKFHQTKLGLIKESEDSDDADPASSNENSEIYQLPPIQEDMYNYQKNQQEQPVNPSIENVDWNPPESQTYYPQNEVRVINDEFPVYEQNDYELNQPHSFMLNQEMYQNSGFSNFTTNQGNYQMNTNPLHNNSTSTTGNIENYSYSAEENDIQDGFNRTQSVRLYPNQINNGGLTSRLNSSYESGVIEDEDLRHSSRSYVSSGSYGSGQNFNSTCARTFASSGGIIDHNNSQCQLTYDRQQMHSSFDLGNDPAYNSYRLTPRHMSDYSYKSNQPYDEYNQFNSFQMYTRNQMNQCGTISCEGINRLRNCFSFTSLNGFKALSNPGDNTGNSSFNSINKQKKNNRFQNDSHKGFRKRCPAQDEDEAVFKINIDNIIEGKEKRTTLMIK